MKRRNLINGFLLIAGLFWLAGCNTPVALVEGPVSSPLRPDGKVVALDQVTREAVTCTAVHERLLPDGQLEVVVDLHNLSAVEQHLQVKAIFADFEGEIGDAQTSFHELVLATQSTESVRFTAASASAKRYVIQVSRAR